MDDSVPLTTVHDALVNAVHASKAPPGEPTSFRLEQEVKARVMAICERHGTTLSEYLRQVCIGIDRDYSAPTRN